MRVLAFHAAGERYLVRLDAVRAVVRLRGLRRLPGSPGALSGVLDVQETSVAVYETRPPASIDAHDSGDVLVLASGWPEHAVGVACDGVEGLLELDDDADLESLSRPPSLPSYVEQLLRVEGRDGALGRRRRSRRSCRPPRAQAARLDVPLEDARLGQSREPLAHRAGAGLADAVDGLQIVNRCSKQFLQTAEVIDESIDNETGQPRHLGQQAVTPWIHRGFERIGARRDSP